AQLNGITAATVKELASDLAAQLHKIALDLDGSATDPEHLNLRRRLTWLNDQVGNYSGKPTSAQIEWIGIFESQLKPLLLELNNVLENRLPVLNQRLNAMNLAPVSAEAPAAPRRGR